MPRSTRRPQQIFAVVMWVLSVIFAGFLIGLGGLLIRDIPSVDQRVLIEDFIEPGAVAEIESRQQSLAILQAEQQRAAEDAATSVADVADTYRAAERDFAAWIATRSATEAASTNPEVLRRTNALEALNARVQRRQENRSAANAALVQTQRALEDVKQQRRALRDAARPDYERARRARELRVFAFRLALTLPLLLIAGWMVMRKRGSAYWPLYRGFVLFALFAFFIELVPYLPNYGGYVRYIVGIAVVLASGYVLIKQMRRYLARKQAEEARSEDERRQSIGYETALKKIAANSCPGCDRAIVKRDGVHVDYCVHCGIHLQRPCPNCDVRNVTFYRYCLSCGTPNADLPAVGEGEAGLA